MRLWNGSFILILRQISFRCVIATRVIADRLRVTRHMFVHKNHMFTNLTLRMSQDDLFIISRPCISNWWTYYIALSHQCIAKVSKVDQTCNEIKATLVVKYGELVTMDQMISQAWPLSMSNNSSNNKTYLEEYNKVSLKYNPISHCSV